MGTFKIPTTSSFFGSVNNTWLHTLTNLVSVHYSYKKNLQTLDLMNTFDLNLYRKRYFNQVASSVVLQGFQIHNFLAYFHFRLYVKFQKKIPKISNLILHIHILCCNTVSLCSYVRVYTCMCMHDYAILCMCI